MWSMSCAKVGLNQMFLELPSGKVKRRSLWRRRSGVCCFFSSTQNAPVQMPSLTSIGSGPISVSSLLEVVADDLHKLNTNLKSLVGAENPVLVSAAEQIFGAGGKRLRPALVFLVSRATAELASLKDLTVQHQRLAEIIEMTHTASLIHDDVLDDSELRRGSNLL